MMSLVQMLIPVNIINVSSMNFINPYITENHAVEEALKERYLIAKGASPGYKDVI